MTVKELTEELAKMPQDAEVFHKVNTEDYGCLGYHYVSLSTVTNEDGEVTLC